LGAQAGSVPMGAVTDLRHDTVPTFLCGGQPVRLIVLLCG